MGTTWNMMGSSLKWMVTSWNMVRTSRKKMGASWNMMGEREMVLNFSKFDAFVRFQMFYVIKCNAIQCNM